MAGRDKVAWVIDYYGTRVLDEQSTPHLEGVLDFLRNNDARSKKAAELRVRIYTIIRSRNQMLDVLLNN